MPEESKELKIAMKKVEKYKKNYGDVVAGIQTCIINKFTLVRFQPSPPNNRRKGDGFPSKSHNLVHDGSIPSSATNF